MHVAALEGLALALRLLPLDAAAAVFGEAGLGLRWVVMSLCCFGYLGSVYLVLKIKGRQGWKKLRGVVSQCCCYFCVEL